MGQVGLGGAFYVTGILGNDRGVNCFLRRPGERAGSVLAIELWGLTALAFCTVLYNYRLAFLRLRDAENKRLVPLSHRASPPPLPPGTLDRCRYHDSALDLGLRGIGTHALALNRMVSTGRSARRSRQGRSSGRTRGRSPR
jgi:hypothetical protein